MRFVTNLLNLLMNKPILITGGAGYIGSHAALALMDRGESVVILDDLSESKRTQVPHGAIFEEGSMGNTDLVTNILSSYGIESVMHFAGFIRVDESVREPEKYYKNNVENTRVFAETCVAQGVKHFIFSSSASVYGNPERIPIGEEDKLAPINPYGETKMKGEEILLEFPQMQKGILRYFNVAGADPSGRAGYRLEAKPTHMIRSCVRAFLENETFVINGKDYPTEDGTCVRDYIHVSDLASAHLKTLDYLRNGGITRVYNCGDGHGHSNLEVVKTFGRVAGKELPYTFGPRREGDPARLIADSRRIQKELNWAPSYSLEDMVRDELRWVRSHVQR
jgi:UDP-glucose 4-epimerase